MATRSEFEANAHYVADETDLLAFYIDNGFNIGEKEYDGTTLVIYGMSEMLAPYYMSVWTREKVEKPKRPFAKWWKLILDQMDVQPLKRVDATSQSLSRLMQAARRTKNSSQNLRMRKNFSAHRCCLAAILKCGKSLT